MAQIKAAYPQSRQEFSDETIALWLMLFENVPDIPFRGAILDHIQNSTFPPTIADIRKRIQDMAIEKSAGEREWRQLLYSLGRWMPGAAWDYDVDPPTRAGLDAIGGAKRLVGLEERDEPFVRKEFIAAYDDAQRGIVAARLGLVSGVIGMPELGDQDRKGLGSGD